MMKRTAFPNSSRSSYSVGRVFGWLPMSLLFVSIALFGGHTALGQEDLETILAEYGDATEALKQELLKTVPEQELSQNWTSIAPLEKLAHFGPRFLAIARARPATPKAWQALRVVLYTGGFSAEDKAAAVDQVVRDHLDEPEFIADLYFHHYRPGIEAMELYRRVLEARHAPQEAVGLSAYSLAIGLSGTLVGELPSGEERAEAAALLARVVEEFADMPHPWKKERTLGEAAKAALFDLQHLQIDCIAPPIVGADADGQRIELADYRGKIVLVVFCGEWCGPCRAMYPYEKALVSKYGSEHIAILGVNSDPKHVLREAIEREAFPWRWIWDQGSTDGPLQRQWNISSYPTFFLLDAEHVIRGKYFKGKTIEEKAQKIDEAVQQLMAEQEKGCLQ